MIRSSNRHMSTALGQQMSSTSGRVRGSGFGSPPADTGNRLLDSISNALTAVVRLERRVDPFFRPAFDALLRDRLSQWTTAQINKRRRDERYRLADQRIQP